MGLLGEFINLEGVTVVFVLRVKTRQEGGGNRLPLLPILIT